MNNGHHDPVRIAIVEVDRGPEGTNTAQSGALQEWAGQPEVILRTAPLEDASGRLRNELDLKRGRDPEVVERLRHAEVRRQAEGILLLAQARPEAGWRVEPETGEWIG